MLSTLLALTLAMAQVQNPVEAMALPPGAGAWVVKVFTSGGFTGQGGSDFAVTSDGHLACNGAHCSSTTNVAGLQSLVDAIVARGTSVPGAPPTVITPSVCNDCISRSLFLIQRDAMGRKHTFSASWSDGAGGASPEFIQLYNAVVALKH